ncbi:MAG: exodeoxyribonuclease VII large subunit, partial [Actinomycetota bacterium]|nr:exodeoxyribonuclease VII large subunit [Actinomycetota bacterium]
RGGGSIQDLEPFNSEEVARTIAAMSVPVITGVGHEPDVSIADLVADRRASTPTAAAETAVPEKREINAFLKKSAGALLDFSTSRVSLCERHLNSVRNRPLYRGYMFLLGPFMQRLESCSRRLAESPGRALVKSRSRLELVSKNPIYRKPDMLLAPWRTRLWALRSTISKAKGPVFESKKSALEAAKARCEALSPLSILERGYSIVFKKSSGKVVRSSREVKLGDELDIRLGEGRLDANVTGKE